MQLQQRKLCSSKLRLMPILSGAEHPPMLKQFQRIKRMCSPNIQLHKQRMRNGFLIASRVVWTNWKVIIWNGSRGFCYENVKNVLRRLFHQSAIFSIDQQTNHIKRTQRLRLSVTCKILYKMRCTILAILNFLVSICQDQYNLVQQSALKTFRTFKIIDILSVILTQYFRKLRFFSHLKIDTLCAVI